MATIHLVEGPVGAGKSTFAASLAAQAPAVHLNLDDWFSTLHGPDRPAAGVMAWYVPRKWRCAEQIWQVAQSILRCGTDVVLELGLLTREERATFYGRADDVDHDLVVHVLDAPRAVRRERVRRRNLERGETFRMVVPDEVFELASDRWEDPDPAECLERAVRRIAT